MQHLFLPYIKPEPDIPRFLGHPLFQLMGFRGAIAQHTPAEEALLQKYARDRKSIVEIGVAEGASAVALRHVADPVGTLYLIDPYPSGRMPGLNFTKLVAHRYVSSYPKAKVRWIEEFSFDASKTWDEPIDFLFLDGDHAYESCLQDWNEWSPFVISGGIAVFHDARIFPNGWTKADWGPVRVVNQIFRENSNPDWRIIDEVDSMVFLQKIN
jgi:predicted O-methyltransferase YrrM